MPRPSPRRRQKQHARAVKTKPPEWMYLYLYLFIMKTIQERQREVLCEDFGDFLTKDAFSQIHGGQRDPRDRHVPGADYIGRL